VSPAVIYSRKVALAVIVVNAALATVWLSSCFSERQSATGPGTGAGECRIPISSPAVGTVIVFIKNFAFVPQQVSIKRGTTVTWVNCDDPGTDSHTSTSDTGLWSSPTLASGDTYSRTFNDPTGTVSDYHCIPHPFMVGTVILQ
jgi:plastocyanin